MLLAAVLALIAVLLVPFAASAESLPGSNFEIDTAAGVGANLVVDGNSPAIDWASVTEIRRDDVPAGANDDSFTQGTAEDTEPPVPDSGSIPPNKSDLKTFGVYQEGEGADTILHLFWSRVQNPKGTTNMDFEFNQSTTPSANLITPVRTSGDLLIEYKLAKGGRTRKRRNPTSRNIIRRRRSRRYGEVKVQK